MRFTPRSFQSRRPGCSSACSSGDSWFDSGAGDEFPRHRVDSGASTVKAWRLIDATRVGLMTEAEGVLHREGEVYGARDPIGRVAEVQSLARSPRVMEIIAAVLAPGAFAVRGLFFDKT